ncbi:polysaccharide deacetylase family protein [Alicyclobacillus fastidiosus]|uniref:Polysaccharide deacetylase family protein n=1 Tax=Alicyclobacillus fastidiosus TaxID=392011 RepID=A0ABY6ZA89_9BACL|nr:polysaccharide deacetylase family protein [Alicyclobacillus fastidiosus]WAH39784.1 polysaccharide deacetylase family protein [Alicyclobacillus fastidiosus]
MNKLYARRLHIKIYRMFVVMIGASIFLSLAPTTTASAAVKKVYLTFDDGPDPVYTPLILDTLRGENVKATFFVLGSRAEQSPNILRRIHNDGHEIGNHGYYHTFIVRKPQDWVKQDIIRTDTAIHAVCGVKPKYYRPPGGILSQKDLDFVVKTGHPVAMWTVDTNDWKAKNASSIINTVREEAFPNAIILLHDGTPSSMYTVKALPSIIHDLRSSGYTFAILPEQYHGKYIGRPTDSTNYRFNRK